MPFDIIKTNIYQTIGFSQLNFKIKLYIQQIRLVAELVLFSGAILYILAALRESRFLGYNMFIENLVNKSTFQSLFIFINWYFWVSDDCPISGNVSILLLSDDDRSMASSRMPNGIGRSCNCGHNADDSAILLILLSVGYAY